MAALALVAMLATGCAVNKPFAALESDPEIVTSSVTKPVQAEGVDPRDAETIKMAVAQAQSAGEDSHLLAWSNPETGSSGTITAIDQFVGSHGQSCKKFRTTVDSFMGISLYNGETCELKKGLWVLSWFLRDGSS